MSRRKSLVIFYLFIVMSLLLSAISFREGLKLRRLGETIEKEYVYIASEPEIVKFYPDSDYMTFSGRYTITYYCPCKQCCGNYANDRPQVNGKNVVSTASGDWAQEGVTVAVDPTFIPLGTKLYIEGIGVRVAQDTGVRGKVIDIYFNDHTTADAKIFSGVHNVWIINENVNLIS